MNIVLSIITLVVLTAVLLLAIKGARHLLMFYSRPCKYCGHSLVFRGEKERKEGNIYLFECPKCKSWEEVPVSDFHDNNIDSSNLLTC